MRHDDAVSLIRGGVPQAGGRWADLGAGSGVFTRALAEILGDSGVIHAVDRDVRVMELRARQELGQARIAPQVADFTEALPFDGLDGILMANALHFVENPEPALTRIVGLLRPGGAFVLVEYDITGGNPWIPHPVPRARFDRLAADVGLGDVREVGRMRSRYGSRDLYSVAAVAG